MNTSPSFRPVPEGHYSAEIVVKKSRFLAVVCRADSLAHAREHVAALSRAYPDARHVCTGMRIEDGPTVVERSSDDGEPSGTAGAPILDAIRAAGVVNVCVVVVRWFGGTKLGTGGLARAYREAAQQALHLTPLVRVQRRMSYRVTVPLRFTGQCESVLSHHDALITAREYGARESEFTIACTDVNAVWGQIASVTSGASQLEQCGEIVVEISVGASENR